MQNINHSSYSVILNTLPKLTVNPGQGFREGNRDANQRNMSATQLLARTVDGSKPSGVAYDGTPTVGNNLGIIEFTHTGNDRNVVGDGHRKHMAMQLANLIHFSRVNTVLREEAAEQASVEEREEQECPQHSLIPKPFQIPTLL